MKRLLTTGLVWLALPLFSAGAWAITINVPADQPTIQAAITAASPGDLVLVADGTYSITSPINVNKAITISGTTEAGTILNVNTGHDAYGINPSVGGVTLQDFTIVRATTAPATRSGYMIHASGTPNVQNGLTIQRLTVQGTGSVAQHRAGIDIHGYDNVVLSYVTSKDAPNGNGIQLTGCAHVDVDHAVTQNNAWGSLAIYCSQYLAPQRACDDVYVGAATCTFNENNVFIENQFGLTSTNINIDGYLYWLRNTTYRAGATGFIHIQPDLVTAQAFAAIVFAGHAANTSFQNTSTWAFEVYSGMTIQAAINAAAPGDVIEVAPGTYAEQILINKALTINGEDGAIINGTGLAPTWTTGVQIKSGNVTFNNLDVTNFTQDGIVCGYEASIPGNLHNIHITNCAISNIQPGNWGFGIYVGYESEGFGYIPPKLTDHLDYSGLLIENNEITNTHSSALVIQSVTSSAGNLMVRNNNIHDNVTNDGIWVETARNLTIENNIIHHNYWGIEFTCLAEPWYLQDGPHSPKNIIIRNNQITSSLTEGLALYNGWPSTILVSNNIIQGNTTGLLHHLPGALNLGSNWWGNATGPTLASHPSGTGDNILGTGATSVDFTPWLASGVDMDPGTFGFQGDFSTLWVDDDSPQIGAVGRIQEGIDLVSGSTVYVAAGHYVEQLHITTSDLNLIGAGKALTFVDAPNSMPLYYTTSANNYPVVFVEGCTGVSISNLTVDGLGRGNTNYRFQGVGFWNAGGSVLHANIDNISDTPFSGAQHGVGIYAFNDTGGPYTVVLNDVLVDDYQKGGVALNGAGLTVDLDAVTVHGAGPTAVTAQNGIQIAWGAGGTMTNCVSDGNNYTGPGWSAAGVLLYFANAVQIDGAATQVLDNYVGIDVNDCSAIINGALVSNQNADAWDGIYVRSTGVALAQDNGRPLPPASPLTEAYTPPNERVGRTFSMANATVLGHDKVDSWGLYLKSSLDNVDATVTNSVIKNWDVGTYVKETAPGTVTSTTTASSIESNVSYGFFVNGTTTQMAEYNWWGSVTGPFHSSNPAGTGNQVSDFVDFTPYTSGQYDVTQSLTRALISVADGAAYQDSTVWTMAIGPLAPAAPAWRQVTVWLSWDPALVAVSPPEFLFTHADGVINGYDLVAPGQMEVSLAISGATAGQNAATDLFRCVVDGLAEPLSPYTTPLTITSVLVRDTANPPVAIPASCQGPLDLTVDGTVPVTTATFPAEPCLNGAFLVNLGASDNVALDLVEMQIDALGWNTVAGGLPGTSWSNAAYSVSVTGLGEGDHTVCFRSHDDVGYTGLEVCWAFHLDTEPPVAASGLDATPQHHTCNLFWTAASEHDGYTLYWKQRTGYPYPGGLPAVWNGTLATADGDTALAAGAATFAFGTANNFASRGVYDFRLVAEDCVNAPAMSGVASATNYFLGDVVGTGGGAYDGLVWGVGPGDLGVMGAVYGSTPSTNPGMEMNVGPTSDASSYGLPAYGVTTARVNFEDLIIFAMNYGIAGPELPISSATPAGPATLRLEASGETQVLTLSGQLKGFSARVETDAALLEATADFPVFFYRDANAWIVDAVSLSGLLADGSTIVLRFGEGAAPSLASADGRDARNQRVEVTAFSPESLLPTSYALAQNFPNPFNPTTTIRYALPEAAAIRLALYNALGQEVLVLVQGDQTAGYHEVRLDGSSLASGVYVYRLEAGRFVDQKKMILVK